MIKKVDEELGVSSGHNSEGGFEVIEESNPRFHMATGAGYEDFHPELSKEKTAVIKRTQQSHEKDIDNDYDYQRQNFYNLVERGNDAIEGILELAKESEHPRAYEVAGNLIKQVPEVTEKLGQLQTNMKKLKELPDDAPKNVTNALFVGSTAELQKMLKGK